MRCDIWKITKGNAGDFTDCNPIDATHKYISNEKGHCVFTRHPGIIRQDLFTLVASRELIEQKSVTVDISTPCGEDDLNNCIGAPEASMERIERNGKVWSEFDLDAFLAEHGCQQSELLISRCKPIKVGDIHIDGKWHEAKLGNKYLREIKPGVWVDVYDVLSAWSVTNPALQHLIKKALQTGERGHKTREQDLQDIIDSAIRAKELEQK